MTNVATIEAKLAPLRKQRDAAQATGREILKKAQAQGYTRELQKQLTAVASEASGLEKFIDLIEATELEDARAQDKAEAAAQRLKETAAARTAACAAALAGVDAAASFDQAMIAATEALTAFAKTRSVAASKAAACIHAPGVEAARRAEQVGMVLNHVRFDGPATSRVIAGALHSLLSQAGLLNAMRGLIEFNIGGQAEYEDLAAATRGTTERLRKELKIRCV